MPANSAAASGLATRYAAALFELAREQEKLDAVASDLEQLSSMLDENEDLRRVVESPAFSRDDQRAAMGELARRAGFQDIVANVLGVLSANGRLFALRQVIDAFARLLADHRGEIQAEVVSAQELSPEQLQAVEESVARFAGKHVKLTRSVDGSLLGGLVVRIGSRMIDASLRSKLQQLELSMRGIG